MSWRLVFFGFLLFPLGCSLEGSQRVLYCAECDLEMPYSEGMAKKPCPICGPKSKALQVGSRGEKPLPAWQRVGTVILIAAVLLQVGAYLIILWRRSRFQAEQAQAIVELRCRCPFCKRKMRYLQSRVGQGVVCRGCKTAFPLPVADLAEEIEDRA